jgi:hypothetical protein
MKHLEKD